MLALVSLQGTSLTFARIGCPMEVAVVRIYDSAPNTCYHSLLTQLSVRAVRVQICPDFSATDKSATDLFTLRHHSAHL